MATAPEFFGQLLQEKMDELDEAYALEAAEAAALEIDEVEQLRLRAAHLVTGSAGRAWPTGAMMHYQQDRGAPQPAPSTLDIRFPARSQAIDRPKGQPD